MPARIRQFFRRLNVYGDLTIRLQTWGSDICPRFLEPVFIFGYSLIFFAAGGPVRRTMIRNLGALLPGSHPAGNLLRAFRVFLNFSATITDAARVRHGEHVIEWEIEGIEHLNEIVEAETGVIVLTAHMGNYDVAAPMLANQIEGRRLHAVRAPERDADTQEWMREKLAEQQDESYVIHYNTPDSHLGIDLIRVLDRGEIVAIQGDRVEFEVATIEVPHADQPVNSIVPKGPFALSMAARVPIYPLFIIHIGDRLYRTLVYPPIQPSERSRNREDEFAEVARQWVEILLPVARKYWYQWFVFAPVFEERKNDSP